MLRSSLRAFGTVAVGLLACAPASASADTRILVGFEAGVDRPRTERLLTDAGARPARDIRQIGVRVASVSDDRAAAAVRSLRGRAGVRFAELDGLALPQESLPDDPYFPRGTYALGGGAWGWQRTQTTLAWDLTQGSEAVKVAVLDTGLKSAAQDFDGQVVPGRNVLTGTSDTSAGAGNHGTYVAGVVGLAAGNGAGNAGYCPGCRVMPVQVGTDSGAAYSDMASGIVWAVDAGARVVNLSWAGTSPSSTLASAVSYARTNGAIVFASAGNSNCDCPTYPSATPGVIGVGSVTSTGAKAGDSNFGSWVALAAPSGNMTSWPTLNGAPGFAQVGGTSLASPAAAAIAGLVLSARPDMTVSELEDAVLGSAEPASFAVRHGEIDALAALQRAGVPVPQAVGAPANLVGPRVLTQVNGDKNVAPLRAAPQVGDVLVRGQGAWRGQAPLSLSRVRWDRCQADGTACTAIATATRYTVQSADTGFTLRAVVTVSNGAGATTAAAPVTPVVGGSATPPPPQPSPPANLTPPAISGTAQDGQTVSSSTGTWSESPTSYAYAWQRCDTAGSSCTPIPGATAPTYVLSAADVGATLRVAVTAANDAGSATAVSAPTATVAAAPAPAPEPDPQPALSTTTWSGSLSAKQPTATYALDVGTGSTTAKLTFSKCASLELSIRSPSGTVATVSGPSTLTVTRELQAGRHTFTVGGSTRCSFTLSVTAPSP